MSWCATAGLVGKLPDFPDGLASKLQSVLLTSTGGLCLSLCLPDQDENLAFHVALWLRKDLCKSPCEVVWH